MRVQHPSRTRYEIAPAGGSPIDTDDDGITPEGLPPALLDQLVAQGWIPITETDTDPEGPATPDEETP